MNKTDLQNRSRGIIIFVAILLIFPTYASGAVVPKVSDPNLRIEEVVSGLRFPASMTFVSPNEILVLEKDEGTVRLVKNGKIIDSPVLKVNVSNRAERGMLGIDIMSDEDSRPEFAFVYFTENARPGELGNQSNRLYRYNVTTDISSSIQSSIGNLSSDVRFVDAKLLLDLPAEPVDIHNGGKVTIGPDNKIYLIIGDVNHKTRAQNYKPGPEADGTGGILVIDGNGTRVKNGILGNTSHISDYYAYGIRNGFGLDFDPLSGKLWDTENGWTKNDEINLIEPGFNSGWIQVQGKALPKFKLATLETFDGKGNYSDPELSWFDPVAPTALEFLQSNKLGKQYENDLFVASFGKGKVYHFDLYANRSGLLLQSQLSDKIANNEKELKDSVFVENIPGGITDVKTGPDGYLYLLQGDIAKNEGTIYRVIPN